MQFRRLGSSGLKVSAVSLGGWITFGGTIDEDTARAIVWKAIDGGINFIDLADVYARGQAEEVVGRMLPEYDRQKLILSSKVFWPMSDDVNDRGLSRKHIVQSAENTLRRLGTDYLDIYFCHREDPETPMEETVAAMDDLIRQGKVLYWGTSVWSPKGLREAHDVAARTNRTGPQVEQPMYNLLDRGIERKVMPTAARLGMGLVVWSPLAGGLLTGKYNDSVPEGSRARTTNWLDERLNEETLTKTRRFCAIAEAAGVRPEQLALAQLLRREEVSSVITGATRPEHVEINLQAAELEVPDEVARQVDRLFGG